MIVIILLIFCQLSFAIHLEPVKVFPVITNEIKFIANTNSGHDAIITTINHQIANTDFSELNNGFLQTVVKDISLAIGMPNTIVHHLRWETIISSNMGTMKVYSVTAHIDNFNINLISKYVKLEQQIPDQFETREHCARTGSRRYGIAGPRSRECYYYQIKRDLHPDEIELINQNLLNKINDAKILVSH
jgi:hypothetical protein